MIIKQTKADLKSATCSSRYAGSSPASGTSTACLVWSIRSAILAALRNRGAA